MIGLPSTNIKMALGSLLNGIVNHVDFMPAPGFARRQIVDNDITGDRVEGWLSGRSRATRPMTTPNSASQSTCRENGGR
jgi:hypothetical protein